MKNTKVGDKVWERVKRVPIYESPKNVRFPSVEITETGRVLALFTRQTEDQMVSGSGDLLLIESADGGNTWTDVRTVFEGSNATPKAHATLTGFTDGSLIAPFALEDSGQDSSTISILRSDDQGKTWNVAQPRVESPLEWIRPTGRVQRGSTDVLAMSVFGAPSMDALKATKHSVGVLFSKDGGNTWDDYSEIATGGESLMGAAPSSTFSFEAPSIQKLADGRWLCIMTARRLEDGPGAPQVLCRTWSADEGRSWSPVNQFSVGAYSALAAVGENTLVCPFTDISSFTMCNAILSDDGFETFSRELPLLMRGWRSGCGRHNVYDEVPPYPYVPYLGENDWPFNHFGFPSAALLDESMFVVAIVKPQRGVNYYHHIDLDKPADAEQIDLIFYELRDAVVKNATRPSRGAVSKERWVLSSRFDCGERFSTLAECPDGSYMGTWEDRFIRSRDKGETWERVEGARIDASYGHPSVFGVLESGRWILIAGESVKRTADAPMKHLEYRGGYPVTAVRNHGMERWARSYYSDDEGRTWLGGQKILEPAVHVTPQRGFYFASDGTLLFNAYGCLSEEENDSYSSSVMLFRSTDEGESWGDMSVIARPEPKKADELQPEPRYTEAHLQMLPDESWVVFMRTEFGMRGSIGSGRMSRTVSKDLGHTWSKPEPSVISGAQQQLLLLPDGALALISRSHSWQQAAVCVSYDLGYTWNYALAGPYNMGWAFLVNDREFIVIASVGKATRYNLESVE